MLTLLYTQGFEELAQAGETIKTAQENLQLVRDVYAGVNDFVNFDPQAFLDGQKDYWLAQMPIAGDAQSFVNDISTNGLGGGSSSNPYNRLDVYRDAFRRKEAQRAFKGSLEPYDGKKALTVSREAETALSNSSTRVRLANKPEPATVAEGLFAVDAAKGDPQLLALYMQRRAAAKEAEYQAFKLYSESLGASPGKAQQLAAMAAGITAQELARIDDKLTQSVAMQQLEQQQRSSAKATERRETDFLWRDLEGATQTTFAPPTRGTVTWKDFDE